MKPVPRCLRQQRRAGNGPADLNAKTSRDPDDSVRFDVTKQRRIQWVHLKSATAQLSAPTRCFSRNSPRDGNNKILSAAV